MASSYFENIDFYRDLVSRSSSEVNRKNDSSVTSPPYALPNEVSDTTICTRIRPLAEEEEASRHIYGIVAKPSSKAVLFEPRKKFNGTPDVTVSGRKHVWNDCHEVLTPYSETWVLSWSCLRCRDEDRKNLRRSRPGIGAMDLGRRS